MLGAKKLKKNQTPMNQQWKLVLLGQLSLNTAKDSDPAVAITRLSITNYFKNTEKVF